MKAVIAGMIAAASLALASSAFASDAAIEMLKKNNCLACHQIEGPKVGPSYMDVARKYRDNAGAASKLEIKVAKGGSGVWGTMPMPANSPRVGKEEIKIMVRYILSLAK